MENYDGLEWLFDVDNTINIPDIGFVLIVDLDKWKVPKEIPLKINDSILVQCVDGKIVRSRIRSFEMINMAKPEKSLSIKLHKSEDNQFITKGASVLRER